MDRILRQTSWPSISGITMSSKTRSTSSVSSNASASAPDDAVRTRCPRGVRTASRSLKLAGWSSTASTVTGVSISRPARRGNASTCPGSARTLIGFSTYPSKPARDARSRSSAIAKAVTATTGTSRPRLPCLNLRSVSVPSMPGSWRSISTRSGGSSWATRRPSSPDWASTTSYPANWRTSRTSLRFNGLSSTTRIRRGVTPAPMSWIRSPARAGHPRVAALRPGRRDELA